MQGACVALELASRQIQVDLYEQLPTCVAAASAQNEGKIHLGYLFALDTSMRSASAMARGALSFHPLMQRWTGAGIDRVPVSTPYVYAVHRDSMVEVDILQSFYLKVHELHGEMRRQMGSRYFSAMLDEPPRRLGKGESEAFDPALIKAAFLTNEIAVDAEALAEVVRLALTANDNIRINCSTRVLAVKEKDRGLVVESIGPAGPRHEPL